MLQPRDVFYRIVNSNQVTLKLAYKAFLYLLWLFVEQVTSYYACRKWNKV